MRFMRYPEGLRIKLVRSARFRRRGRLAEVIVGAGREPPRADRASGGQVALERLVGDVADAVALTVASVPRSARCCAVVLAVAGGVLAGAGGRRVGLEGAGRGWPLTARASLRTTPLCRL